MEIKAKVLQKDLKRNYKFLGLKYLNFGVYIAAPILMGLTIGLFLDTLLKVKPLLTVFFLFIGTSSGFYNIYKIIKEQDASHKH